MEVAVAVAEFKEGCKVGGCSMGERGWL